MPLRIKRRAASPHWQLTGTVRGVLVRETTGTDDEQAAQAIRARREWEITQGSIFGHQQPTTFLAAAVLHLEAGGEARYIRPLTDCIGHLPLDKIDQATIDRTARALYPNAAPGTLNRQAYAPISAVLNHAARRGLCARPTIERPRLPKGRVRWISFDEAERLIEACAPHLRPLIVFLLGTGARMSEALRLDWREVDLARGQVVFLDTKNGEDRGVPLHPRVALELQAVRHRKGKVFHTPAGDAYPVKRGPGGGQIKTGFNGACRRAGIVDFHPHDCRHTFATWHYAANRDLAALMKLGGWKSERMVLRYAHVNTAHLAASIEAGLAGWHRAKSAKPPKRKSGMPREIKTLVR